MAFNDFRDGVTFSGLSADTPDFTVAGGRYALSLAATWGGGSATLQQRMPDGTTYVSAATPLTANGTALVDLPRGAFKLAIATATAVQGSLVQVPFRNV